jgi:ParB family transcriptional regulator, chromosome partitioning protein
MSVVAIDQVCVHANRRPLNDQKVAELMQSIKANGLLNPITLDQHCNLIAGLHRLTACKLLGFVEIECHVVTCEDADQARLAEIDENLIRNELEALERAELWLERDRILERMGLRAKSGDNQFTRRGGETNSRPAKTTLELAQEVGYTERTFQLGKQIARDIAPEVKQVIKGTPVAKSSSVLLRVARAGSKERQRAEQIEQTLQDAKQQQPLEAVQQQVAEARAAQTKLQLLELQNALAEKEARKSAKQERPSPRSAVVPSVDPSVNSRRGDVWVLEQHLIYCGDTATSEFRALLPSNAALSIVTPAAVWNHDYLIDEAQIVVVFRTEGQIYPFCKQIQMPFQFEWLFEQFYITVYAATSLLKPEKPAEIEGIEGIVAYLINLYTKPSNFVIAPFLGHGEVLMACERTGRICFAGDQEPERVNRSILRWQKWTSKTADREN